MTRICVTDEQHLSVIKRLRDLERRIVEGTIPFDSSMDAVQRISEADFAFSIWKTITVGTHKSGKTLLAMLKREGFSINDRAEDILTQKAFPVASKRTDVSLVVVTGYGLGFTKAVPLRDIIAAGEDRGLVRCRPEDGPQLRRKHDDQFVNVLMMVMDPVADMDGRPFVFRLTPSAGAARWLVALWSPLDTCYSPGRLFVFRSRP